ncbi:UNVERIFIED_CONTAM: Transposon Ty3-G Gag-Pol polyprotein [Sesamum angustifolium]|uniref:Transposon Ty3-G Gag-Pol polyprotein n=1 Tax=Sesamum angustifolium TaxID=2727405 RepID=A0AAW2QT82_9LAMI
MPSSLRQLEESDGDRFCVPEMSKPFTVETDASDYALGGVLMQDGHPVAFESRKLKDVERRYSMHEKELLVVVHCLRLWRHYLLGSPFVVKTDNTTVSHFMTQPKLTNALSRRADLAILGLVAAFSSRAVATSVRDRAHELLSGDLAGQGLVHLIEQGKARQFWLEAGLLMLKPFVGDLGSIIVVVERLSKYATFIAAPKHVTAEGTAHLFFKHVVKYWGLPKDVVSDRNSRFTGIFWTELFKLLGSKLSMSSSYHPQSDSQTERFNSIWKNTFDTLCALKKYSADKEDDTHNQPSRPQLELTKTKEKLAEAILNHRVTSTAKCNHKEYLVKWKGCSSEENTWERVTNLKVFLPLVEAYHASQALRMSPSQLINEIHILNPCTIYFFPTTPCYNLLLLFLFLSARYASVGGYSVVLLSGKVVVYCGLLATRCPFLRIAEGPVRQWLRLVEEFVVGRGDCCSMSSHGALSVVSKTAGGRAIAIMVRLYLILSELVSGADVIATLSGSRGDDCMNGEEVLGLSLAAAHTLITMMSDNGKANERISAVRALTRTGLACGPEKKRTPAPASVTSTSDAVVA